MTAVLTEDEDSALALLRRDQLPGINYISRDSESLLHVAVRNWMTRVALAVLAHPEFDEVNSRDLCGSTALHIAAEQGSCDLCAAILGRSDFREILARSNAMTARQVAAQGGFDATAEILSAREKAFKMAHSQELP